MQISKVLRARAQLHGSGASSSTPRSPLSPTHPEKYLLLPAEGHEEEEPLLVTETVMISGSGIVPLLHSPRGRDLSSLGSPRSITSESELEAFLSPRVAAAEPTGELGSSAAALQAGGGSSGGVFAPSSYSCPAGVVDEVQLVKAMLSPGILALPYAFTVMGAVPGTVAAVLTAALACSSACCLARGALAPGEQPCQALASRRLGRAAAVALSLSACTHHLGMLAVCLMVAADVVLLGLKEAPELFHCDGCHVWALSLVAMLVAALVVACRPSRLVGIARTMMVAAVAALLVATLAVIALMAGRHQAHRVAPWPSWEWFQGRPLAEALDCIAGVLPVLLVNFMCHMDVASMASSPTAPATPGLVQHTTEDALGPSLSAAIVACFIMYVALALGAQAMLGGSLQPDVLMGFTTSAVAEAVHARLAALLVAWGVRLTFLLAALSSAPLQVAACGDRLAWLLGREATLHGPIFYGTSLPVRRSLACC